MHDIEPKLSSRPGHMQNAYRDDLAYIHDAGFGQFAANAAPVVIEGLRRAGTHSGTIVDLGCGSGIGARLLCDAGYAVVGIDLSEALIQMARVRAPKAEFRVGSVFTTDIPPCVAVTAIGEVFNYTFDAAIGEAARAQAFERVYAALPPGGLFLFDLAGPARIPSQRPQRGFFEGPDWAVLVEVDADIDNKQLTRRITSFRKHGELYRRDFEIHQLHLVDPFEVVELLQQIGFSVQILDCYGSLTLPTGLTGYLAQKPARVTAR